MTSEIVPADGASIAEQVIIKGDLSRLTETERMQYYSEVCRSLGLNPLTRPFEYITLNGKLTLYPTRGAADQLRSIRGISITSLDTRQVGDLLVVVATGRDRGGRDDSATGAVSVKGLAGESLANAMMKAETKAKRRLTLSLAGLGWPDESEVASIPGAVIHEPPPPLSLAERAAQKAASLQDGPQAPAEPSQLPVASDEDLEAPESSTEPTDAILPLTARQFNARLVESKIPVDLTASAFHAHFPDVDRMANLSDEQRGELWATLSRNA